MQRVSSTTYVASECSVPLTHAAEKYVIISIDVELLYVITTKYRGKSPKCLCVVNMSHIIYYNYYYYVIEIASKSSTRGSC